MSESFDRVVRAAARRGRAVGVCPDADVLAAYLDNGLTSDERAAVEQHSADCVPCQQHLGLLGAVSLDPEPPEIEAARSWLARWGWLVPVATAVLVVVVWTRTPAPTAPPEPPRRDQTAATHQPPPASPIDAISGNAADERASLRLGGPAVGTPAPPRLVGRERQDVTAKATPPAAPPPAVAAPQVVAEADRLGPLAETVRVPAEAESKEAAASGARQEARMMRKSAEPALQTAASGLGLYRASGGRIERSRDGGGTWLEVFADASLTFTAVACAPSGPCWFGTASGEVLRTSGDSFLRSKLPDAIPVALITAGTGLEATVTAGPRRYRTTDGTTWVPITQ